VSSGLLAEYESIPLALPSLFVHLEKHGYRRRLFEDEDDDRAHDVLPDVSWVIPTRVRLEVDGIEMDHMTTQYPLSEWLPYWMSPLKSDHMIA
ncbi:hypothetical protein FRC09_013244, partial [Ceratobasidium sp. 395]